MHAMRERPVDSIEHPTWSLSHEPIWLEDRDAEIHRSLPHGAPADVSSDPATNPGCIDPAAVTRLARRLGSRIGRPESVVVALRRPAATDLG
jgi:hypothetical protein